MTDAELVAVTFLIASLFAFALRDMRLGEIYVALALIAAITGLFGWLPAS